MNFRRIVGTALILLGMGAAAWAIFGGLSAGVSAGRSETLPQGISNSPPPTSAPAVAKAPSASHAQRPVKQSPVKQRPVKPPVSRSLPTRITIPAIGVDAPVVTVGVQAGTVGAPPLANRNLAGWFTGTVTPGQDGPALLDGHVNTTAGPSVFANLKNLKPGDRIFVYRHDGSRIPFRATWIQAVSKTAFPWDAVLRTTPGPTLRLVTCGGPFNYSSGHYTDNVIVYADGM
jgi:LPXTG-site transpeptidase (sortase) family protein